MLRGDRNGLGIAALVLGILAVLFSWIPIAHHRLAARHPRRYKTPGPSDSFIHNCYWQRSKNDSGEFAAIISNGNAQGPGSVTVKQGEFFETSGGCTWTKQ